MRIMFSVASAALSLTILSPAIAADGTLDAAKLSAWGFAIKHIEPASPQTNAMALELLHAAADRGDGEAMVQLGEMVLAGRAPLDAGKDRTAEAIRWWELSWQHGATRGYHDIGLLHYNVPVPGTGQAGAHALPVDYGTAFRYFKAAADRGDTKARRYVGICYELGRGVPRDYARASSYYDKNSFYYANLLWDGHGVLRDPARAIAIYTNVASHEGGGDEDMHAAEALARIYAEGLDAPADPAKVVHYQKLAAHYGSATARAALARHAAGLYRQATLLLSRGDYRLAFPMMLEAAALGDAEALRITGSGSTVR